MVLRVEEREEGVAEGDLCACARARVRACVRACVSAGVCVCVEEEKGGDCRRPPVCGGGQVKVACRVRHSACLRLRSVPSRGV